MAKSLRIKKIISDTHIDEDKKDFDIWVSTKSPSTQKRYQTYRHSVRTRRADGYNTRTEKGHLIFFRPSRSDANLPQDKDIKPTSQKQLYSHYYYFRCEYQVGGSHKIIEHRHAYETFNSRHDNDVADNSHEKMFPEHGVLERYYVGTWKVY